MTDHIDHVVVRIDAQRAGAEGESVALAVNELHEALEILRVRDYAGQSEDSPRRIVGVDCHLDAVLLADRNDSVQEIAHVFPQLLLVHRFVFGEQSAESVLRIALIPAGKRELCGIGIHRQHLGVAIDQAGGAVAVLMRKVGAEPVEHRHKVIAYYFYARVGELFYVAAVYLYVFVAGRLAQLDVLVYRNALHYLEGETMGIGRVFDLSDAFGAPFLSGRNVIYRGNDAGHSGNLRNVFETDRIVLAIPAEGHFHFLHQFNLLFWLII